MATLTTPRCLVPANAAGTMLMPEGTIKRIHVNQHVVRHNKKTGSADSVITVQWRSKSYRVATVDIRGPSQVIYSPSKPLSCGAHVWVETTAEVAAN